MGESKNHDLKGKVVFVTGGARGLGEAISRSVAEAGARVVIADIRHDLARELVGKLRAEGIDALPVRLDVQNDTEVMTAVDSVMNHFGRIDALINNAAVDRTVSIEELTIEDWDKIIATNLRGPFVMSKQILPLMRQAGGGHIINIASTASRRAWANASGYHASKWGLIGFSHALHVEARPHNVKVTAVICGGMRTPFLLERFPDLDLNNLQDPADVASTIRYVLSAPRGTVIPEIMTLPMRETSWP